jgi:hypothetical protein
MTLEEATALAQEQADTFGLVMIIVKDDLSEDPGGYECCAEMYRTTLYPDHHKQFWKIEKRVTPKNKKGSLNEKRTGRIRSSSSPLLDSGVQQDAVSIKTL